MSLLSRATTSRTPPADARTGCRDDDERGLYLTDGVSLYRHVGAVSRGMARMVGLEDCRTLEVMLLPIEDLRARRVRLVNPSETG